MTRFKPGSHPTTERPNEAVELSNYITDVINSLSISGLRIIDIEEADYLNLANSESFEFPVIYKVSTNKPLPGFIFVKTISASDAESLMFAKFLLPNYSVIGNYFGQIDANTKPNINEYWIWGNKIWKNLTGSLGDLSDTSNLDNNWELRTPSEANNYIYSEFIITASPDLTIFKMEDSNFLNSISLVGDFANQWGSAGNNNYGNKVKLLNNSNKGVIRTNIDVVNSIISGNVLSQDSGIYANQLSNAQIKDNHITGNGNISHNMVRSTCEINNNSISSVGSTTIPQIAYCELNDNSTINGNVLSGAGACIWDVRAGENSSVNGNSLTGDESGTVTVDACIITDIDQMNEDHIDDNLLAATGNRIQMIWQYGNSYITNCILSEPNALIERVQQTNSTIDSYELTEGSGKTGISDVYMKNSSILNATDINISNVHLENVDLELAGFNVDIVNETINNNKGWFSITRDFSVHPLNSGDVALYNLLPLNARLTDAVLSVDIPVTGTSSAALSAGVQNSDPTCILDAVAVGSLTTTHFSNIASLSVGGLRSLALEASGGNITAGKIRLFVEFII